MNAHQRQLEVATLVREAEDTAVRKGLPGDVLPDRGRDLVDGDPAVPAGRFRRRRAVATAPPKGGGGELGLPRLSVILRKTSFGTWCEAGSRYMERMLTVVATLRIQKRNLLAYLTAACESAITGHPAPSLLPESMQALRQAA